MPKTVLLVMDFQPSIVGRFPEAEPVLAAASRAVDAARDAGVPVLFVRVAFREGFPEIAASNATFTAMRGSSAPSEDDPRMQVHPALGRRGDEPVVTKRRVSAFTGSDLDVLLRGAGAEHLVLAGIATSGVVLSTLRQAADLDFGLTVLADACGDRDVEVHRVLTEKVFPRQATVTTVAEWAATLG